MHDSIASLIFESNGRDIQALTLFKYECVSEKKIGRFM